MNSKDKPISESEKHFTIGDGVKRAGLIQRYQRKTGDPTHRPLQIFSTDPSDSKLDGTRVMVNVPYEELMPGPVGNLFEVVGYDETTLTTQTPIDLDDPKVLTTSGLKPAPTAHFQMQMTYAVAMTTYAAFRKALGRDLHWGFGTPESTPSPARLKLYPFSKKMSNAYYDQNAGAVHFGWFVSGEEVKGRNLRKGKIYTSLSHDIIVHEVSHALLDGLRPNFLKPFHNDTLALHEGFADLVAIFQHFSHRDLLRKAIMRSRAMPGKSHLLTDIARQFGQTNTNPGYALRTAVDDFKNEANPEEKSTPIQYDANLEIHKLGSVLVSAVFEAFTKIFDRKARKYIKVATQGRGILPEGDLEESLVDVLAKEASELAGQFMTICIRAIDYCPPVAVTFGDYLRAMLTADFDLVPDDPYGYRESLVDAFVKRDIPIEDVETLSETALIWEQKSEEMDLKLLKMLQLESNKFADQTANAVGSYILRAINVGRYLTLSGSYEKLGLKLPGENNSAFHDVEDPCIESARISRRVSPDGQLETDLVVEITQKLKVKFNGRNLAAIQGCTVIIDSRGTIRYVIKKDAPTYIAKLQNRLDKQHFDFNEFFESSPEGWEEKENLLASIHQIKKED